MDQSDNILNNLTTVNGKEEFEPKKSVKKKTATKKAVAKKAVQSKPLTSKSPERLSKCSTDQLVELCKYFKVSFSGSREEMINTLLGK
tara:strand:+ start:1990 stop:2253 length:264 start_codon:yes stop_codon:yes gene_type:complete